MNKMFSDKEINNAFAKICKNYMKVMGFDNINNVNILFTNDIQNTRAKYYNPGDLIDKNVNGCFIPTSDNIILINKNKFLGNKDSMGITIIHELIHFLDYNMFLIDYCNNDWNDIFNIEISPAFSLWSEFHAKLFSLYHGRKVLTLFCDDYTEQDIINDYSTNERIKYYYEKINNKNIITYNDIFWYCAELNICEQFNSNFDIVNLISNNLKRSFPDFVMLYNDLKEMKTYDDARKHFNSLQWKLFGWQK